MKPRRAPKGLGSAPMVDMTPVGFTESGAMVAEDIRDLQRWPGHGPSRLAGLFLWLEVKILERAHHLTKQGIGDVRVDLGGGDFLVSQQHLDHPDVDFALEEMSGKGVTQRM